jgi:NAD(P)-dependent dehydrogenase (short-subunit alcohol dehydrogenase family)
MVVVTGASRGIGRVIAERFAANGARVALVGRDRAALTAAADSCGPDALPVVADLSSEDGCEQVAAHCEAELGRIDVLVNNAGIDHDCPFLEFPEAEWRRVLDVNLTGPFLCAQRVARTMAASGAGAIVHVSSIDALGADGTQVAYNASKAGLLGLSRTLAVELGPLGIRSTVVNPGYVATPLTRQYVGEEMYAYMTTRFARVPQGRMADPAEIAGSILFLASDEARHVNGIELTVDGGTTANLYIVETLPNA